MYRRQSRRTVDVGVKKRQEEVQATGKSESLASVARRPGRDFERSIANVEIQVAVGSLVTGRGSQQGHRGYRGCCFKRLLPGAKLPLIVAQAG